MVTLASFKSTLLMFENTKWQFLSTILDKLSQKGHQNSRAVYQVSKMFHFCFYWSHQYTDMLRGFTKKVNSVILLYCA